MTMNNQDLHPLLRRAVLFLENKDWSSADEYCERFLDLDPEYAYAYVIKLMACMKVDREEELGNAETSFRTWVVYQNACRFADSDLRERLNGYLKRVEEGLQRSEQLRIAKKKEEERLAENARKEEVYRKAARQEMSTSVAALAEAIELYKSVPGYKDSEERIRVCKERIDAQKEKHRLLLEETNRAKQKRKRKGVVAAIVIMLAIVVIIIMVNASNARLAQEIERNLVGASFRGTKLSALEKSNGGGALTTVTKIRETEITCIFTTNNTVEIDTVNRYDEEPFITRNGVQQWDSSTDDSQTVSWGDVKISLFGETTVMVDGRLCKLDADSYNRPTSIEINGITCSCD